MQNEKEIYNEYKNNIEFLGFSNLNNNLIRKYIKSEELLIENDFFNKNEILFYSIKINKIIYLIPIQKQEYISKAGFKRGQTFYNIYQNNLDYAFSLRIALMFPIIEKDLNIINDYNEHYKILINNNLEELKEKIINVYMIGKSERIANENILNIIPNYKKLENYLYLFEKKDMIVKKAKNIKGMIKTKFSNQLDNLHKKLRERNNKKINKFKEE